MTKWEAKRKEICNYKFYNPPVFNLKVITMYLFNTIIPEIEQQPQEQPT